MRKHRLFFQFGSILAGFIFWSEFCFADYLLPHQRAPRKSTLYMNLETQAYYSEFNFLNPGEYGDLDNQAFIAFLDYKLALTYRPYPWINITPHFRSKTYFNSYLNANESLLIPFQPTEIGGTISHPIKTSIISLKPAIEVSFPLDIQNTQLRQAIISDESLKVTLSSLFQTTIKRRFTPFFKIGIQYRGKELLSLVQGQVGLKYRDHILEFGVLMAAQNSLTFSSSNPTSKNNLIKKYNSGSLKFYSVNPFSVGLSFWGDIQFGGNFSLFAQYGFDVYGMNYAQGHTLTLGLKFRLMKKRRKRKYRNNYNFKEKTENIDSLLNDESDKELMREIEKLQ